MRSTDKPAQPALSTGTGTNRLSTYDAASHGLGTWKMKGFGNEASGRTDQVMACLFLPGTWTERYENERDPIDENDNAEGKTE